mgnify:FL=1
MLRILACSTLLVLAPSPAFADAKDEAIAACAKILKRDGIVVGASSFSTSGSGERIEVSVKGDGVRATCKTNKGRVTHVDYG